jgi:hypothetical protein
MTGLEAGTAWIVLFYAGLCMTPAALAGCVWASEPESFSVTVVNGCPTTLTVGVAEDVNGEVAADWARFIALTYGKVLAPGESEEFSLQSHPQFDFVAAVRDEYAVWFEVFTKEDMPREYVLSPDLDTCPV